MTKERKTVLKENPFTRELAKAAEQPAVQETAQETVNESAESPKETGIPATTSETTTIESPVVSHETKAEVAVEPVKDHEDLATPEGVQKRLGRQQKKHERELQETRSFMAMQAEQLRKQNELIESYRREMQTAKPVTPTYTPPPYAPQQVASPQPVIDPRTGQYVWPETHIPQQSQYAPPSGSMATHSASMTPEQVAQMAAEQIKQENARAAQTVSQQNAEAQKADHFNKFFKTVEEASNIYEDFDDVVKDNELPIDQQIVDVASFIPKEYVADVLYYVGKNKQELARISRLPYFEKMAEFSRLAFQVAVNKSSRQVSRAPVPTAIKQSPMVPDASLTSSRTPTYKEIKEANRRRFGGR